MSLLTVLPSIILMMTSFTRIIIVLSILRQAIGLQNSPPNQVLIGLALFLSIFVMRPAIEEIGATAYTPYGAGQISIEEAVSRSGRVLHKFMMAQTRESDLKLFAEMANQPAFARPDQVPFSILLPAFVTSELKTAFQIGFLIFLPFLIIDIVVSSTLMALGMMMLSPPIVSMPFKLLLFVLVDGWALTMGSLANSFAPGDAWSLTILIISSASRSRRCGSCRWRRPHPDPGAGDRPDPRHGAGGDVDQRADPDLRTQADRGRHVPGHFRQRDPDAAGRFHPGIVRADP
jgi:flagellar biosynthetic protein FliP